MSTHLKALAKRTNPKAVALFPLRGALLLPGCDLPLNVFEPRYLNMVDDALKGDRLIGMIQPTDAEDSAEFQTIGTLGRIMQFAEAPDGRYMIVLRGLKRFRMVERTVSPTPYIEARVNFSEFVADIDVHHLPEEPEAFSDAKSERANLMMAMKTFAKSLGVQVDWDSMDEIPLPRLVDQAAMISPFGPDDKQSLLEAKNYDERRRLLIGLMHLHSHGNDNGTVQ